MTDQSDHRHPAQPSEFEADVRRVCVDIEQDPYDEDGLMFEAFERWAADKTISAEQFVDAARRVLRASRDASDREDGLSQRVGR